MRKIFRFEDNNLHWDRAWAESDSNISTDLDHYPIKYSNLVMKDSPAHTLGVGCGLGSILKHYHNLNLQITGIDLSPIAVNRLKQENPDLDVRIGDVRNLPFRDSQFDTALAYAIFHNLETDMSKALSEMARVLKPGGRFCVSMFADNLKARLNDYLIRRGLEPESGDPQFRSWLMGRKEFQEMMAQHGLITSSVIYARDVPLLWRFTWLRTHGNGADKQNGTHRMNFLGQLMNHLIMGLIAYQAFNSMIFIGYKTPRYNVA